MVVAMVLNKISYLSQIINDISNDKNSLYRFSSSSAPSSHIDKNGYLMRYGMTNGQYM